MKKIYLYLITDNNKFKIGITSNPKRRNQNYKEHNTNYTFQGIFEVKNKQIEKSIHMSLLKKGFIRCHSYKEWFLGKFTLKDLENEINEYNKRIV